MAWKLIAGASIATLVAIVALSGVPVAGGGAPAPAGSQPAGRDAALQALSGLLEREVEERLRLQQQVDALAVRLSRLEEGRSESSPDTGGDAAGRPAATTGGSRGQATEDAFLAVGFGPAEAAYYRRLHDEAAVERLALANRAAREGWQGTPRYREAMAAIRDRLDGLRDGMDAETYARYLYALGRSNQVRVDRVLDGSPAAAAGLRPGDVLLTYGGERLYGVRDLQRATLEGSAGQMVPLEILREGRRLQAYVPRGALGVSALPERALPPGAATGI